MKLFLFPLIFAIFALFTINVQADDTTTCSDIAYDCEAKKALCKNAAYKNLMAKQCKSTCGTCTS
uniref:ShKT domain-containing protein n=1 Tax=Parastrongyloides trichosuri TaxID=131310 RepID=A0A0N5A1T9_PARTI